MKNWTQSARQKLEAYFARVRNDLQASGADVEEVTEDLRRHVEQEVAGLRLGVVTENDVGNILGRMGAPGSLAALTAEPPPRAPRTAEVSPRRSSTAPKPPGWWLILPGVILPLGTIVFEFFTGACAAVLFDPLPNLAHFGLTLLVPFANLWVLLGLREVVSIKPIAMGWAMGLSIGVSLVYSALLLPVSPLAVVGIMVYLLGLVPLAPYFALGVSVLLQTKLAKMAGRWSCLNLWPGIITGLAALLLASAPVLLTRAGMHLASSEEDATRLRGIQLLRSWGLEEELLRACYGRMGRGGELYRWGKEMSPETARQIFYRVYGKPFNSVPPPKLYAGRANWTLLEQEFTWDDDQGGDRVAGRVKGLGMTLSRQDAVIEANAATAYIEWTMEFRNDSPLQREARAQILLPAGGVVSRLTLWIDGEEREAAFGGRSQVKAAYKEVVAKRRDPVLVTTCGPDRVLVQCFPVPPSGGLMKARVGITAPLVLSESGDGVLRLPQFLERNFTVRDDLKHSLWLDCDKEMISGLGGLTKDQGPKGRHALRGILGENQLCAAGAVIRVRRDASATYVWAKDSRASNGGIVTQRIVQAPAEAPSRILVVVDGATGMKPAYEALARGLAALPTGVQFGCVVAADGAKDLTDGLRASSPEVCTATARALRGLRSEGGHNNVPALIRAWDLAAGAGAATIVWIHGSQPEIFPNASDLQQRFERGGGQVQLISMQALPGPNRLLERLDGSKDVSSATMTGDLEVDLRHLFKALGSDQAQVKIVRARAQAEVNQGIETTSHIVRLWAADEVDRLRHRQDYMGAMQLASLYQLVTPVSGAVVLETQEQYARAGLEPVPATTVPMIPEPSPAALLVAGCLLFWLKRRYGGMFAQFLQREP